MKNCPVDPIDVTGSLAIFGPNCPDLRRKSVRQKPERVELEWAEIPRGIRELLKTVTLTVDIMIVNGIDFLTTLSHSLHLRTIEHIPSRTVKQLGRFIIKIVKLYTLGGSKVDTDTTCYHAVDTEPTLSHIALARLQIPTTGSLSRVHEQTDASGR